VVAVALLVITMVVAWPLWKLGGWDSPLRWFIVLMMLGAVGTAAGTIWMARGMRGDG